MDEKIRSLVTEGLSGAKECPAKNDIIEELTANLTEKYNDLVSSGMEPDAAYDAVVSGMGDLTDVVDFINSSPAGTESSGTDPFSELEGIFKRMASDLKSPLNAATSSIKNTITGSGSDNETPASAMADERNPLRDLATASKTRAAAGSHAYIASAFPARHRAADPSAPNTAAALRHEVCSYDFTAAPGGRERHLIRNRAADVEFYPPPTDDSVMEYSTASWPR